MLVTILRVLLSTPLDRLAEARPGVRFDVWPPRVHPRTDDHPGGCLWD